MTSPKRTHSLREALQLHRLDRAKSSALVLMAMPRPAVSTVAFHARRLAITFSR